MNVQFSYLIFVIQSNKMNPERRPLLMNAEVQGRSAPLYSPDATSIDVRNDDDGMQSNFTTERKLQ